MRVITCFSYKGGSGRTVAAANIAASLASCGRVAAIKEPLNSKVALFDLDVFSAGTHRVFEISTERLEDQHHCFIQDYLTNEIEPAQHLGEGTLTLTADIMRTFAQEVAKGKCRDDFTLFPAKPDPRGRFIVAKYHENLLLELILELEKEGFEYVVLDGESGVRSMADIAIRLSDIVLMFFRLTWQHVDGTLRVARDFLKREHAPAVYLVPTCVPLVEAKDGVYMENAPGLDRLKIQLESVQLDDLNDFVHKTRAGMGHFWKNRQCIHESLALKGGECVVVYDARIGNDHAASDYYHIAESLKDLHPV
jgi:cellulose biosynthesis protein BcsQ